MDEVVRVRLMDGAAHVSHEMNGLLRWLHAEAFGHQDTRGESAPTTSPILEHVGILGTIQKRRSRQQGLAFPWGMLMVPGPA